MSGQVNLGYIPDKYDHRDRTYHYKGTKNPGEFKSVNLWADHQDWLSEVYNQSHSGSCVANATAAAVRYLAKKVGSNYRITEDPSRLFIYYNARAISQESMIPPNPHWPTDLGKLTDPTGGTWIRNAMKSIRLFGIASNDVWGFKVEEDKDQKYKDNKEAVIGVNDRPPNAAYDQANTTHAVDYCRLDPDHPDIVESGMSLESKIAIGNLTLDRLKQCLVEGYPVVFGFNFFWRDWTSEEYLGFPKLNAIPDDRAHKPQSEASHAVLAVGFDNNRGLVLCQNSWGNHPTYKTHFWMPYNWITDFEATDDFWMIRLIEQSAPNLEIPGPTEVQLANPKEWTKTDLPDTRNVALAPASTIASVSRKSNTVEMWWITPAGAVEGVFYYDGQPWRRYQIAPGGAAAPGGIAAVARAEDKTEVWWIAPDGSVQGSHIHHGYHDWVRYSLTGANKANPGAGIAAVSRMKDAMEVWWVGQDKSIQGAYRYQSPDDKWHFYQLAGAKSATEHSSITAISPEANHMEVWWVCDDGSIKGRTFYDNGKGWHDYELAPPKSAAIETRIACASRNKETIEVFFISPLGAVKQRYWYKGQDWLENGLAPSSSARVDSDIKAVSIDGNRYDVVWVGPDNSLQAARGQDPWERYKIATSGSVSAGTPLGIFTRARKTFSVCFTDSDGKLLVANY